MFQIFWDEKNKFTFSGGWDLSIDKTPELSWCFPAKLIPLWTVGYISVLSSGIPDFGSLGISFFALQSFCHISVPLEMSYYSAVLSPAFDKSLQYSHEGNFLSYSPLTSVFAGWLFCTKWRLRLTCRRSRTYPELRDISFLCSLALSLS